jgi:Holliday junction resolvasome RuvABC endonuclease subunit
MNILALDLGTTMGWAANPNGVITSGVITFKPGRFESGGMRYIRFVAAIRELLSKTGAKIVYFEEVRRHLGVDAAHIYGGFLAHLQATCVELDVNHCGVPVPTIKIQATGKGNANKDAMIAAAKQRGWNPVDDNEADALWILDWAVKQNGGAQ